jgi:hypothetical protein
MLGLRPPPTARCGLLLKGVQHSGNSRAVFEYQQLRTYAKHLKWHVNSSESEVFVQIARKAGCLTSFDMTLRKS